MSGLHSRNGRCNRSKVVEWHPFFSRRHYQGKVQYLTWKVQYLTWQRVFKEMTKRHLSLQGMNLDRIYQPAKVFAVQNLTMLLKKMTSASLAVKIETERTQEACATLHTTNEYK